MITVTLYGILFSMVNARAKRRDRALGHVSGGGDILVEKT